uniref:PRESAN domain-containing protein n=1 Tax=Parastrongyloides trichosuri TaxID=131310 RepID=A0A0N4ZJQ5_PARTI
MKNKFNEEGYRFDTVSKIFKCRGKRDHLSFKVKRYLKLLCYLNLEVPKEIDPKNIEEKYDRIKFLYDLYYTSRNMHNDNTCVLLRNFMKTHLFEIDRQEESSENNNFQFWNFNNEHYSNRNNGFQFIHQNLGMLQYLQMNLAIQDRLSSFLSNNMNFQQQMLSPTTMMPNNHLGYFNEITMMNTTFNTPYPSIMEEIRP